MKDRILTRDEDQRPETMQCDCGEVLGFEGLPGADVDCGSCGRCYNASGQLLADPSQWGEETGEHASDYYRGFNEPGHAFDED